VETREELAFLQAHQCDEAQGFYFSRPVLPQQFATLLKTGIPEQGTGATKPELSTIACRHEEYLETNIRTKESKPQTEKT
jgi:hypothetical protein